MAGKPFSNKLYRQDDNAKDAVINWLKGRAWSARVNPDQYGIDVLATDLDGQEKFFEVEVKHNWTGAKFPFDTLHYSERKRKFLATPEHTFFITLNHERTHALLVPGDVLKDSPTVVKDTIYTTNEKFIEVHVDSCALVELETK